MNSEIYELFKQVKVNIPLLDAIKQVPSYAKFLKDLYKSYGFVWHAKTYCKAPKKALGRPLRR
jgi:hypothetical protein